LVEQVRYPPQGAKYKVYIIDEVHMLSTAAFNAFLKTLEEPPSYAIFILATTERHKILPTILSRCQIFNFNRIKIEDSVNLLKSICIKEGVEADDEALHVISQKADGAMRDALTIFDQLVSYAGNRLTYKDVAENLNILDYDYYFGITDAIAAQNMPSVLTTFDEILDKGFDGHLFLTGLAEHFRNLLVSKHPETIKLLEVTESVAKRFAQQSQSIDASLLLNGLNIASQADINYKSARNTRLLVEIALVKMCHIQSVVELKAEDTDKKKTEPLTIAASPTKESIPAIPFKQTAPSSAAPAVAFNIADRDRLLQDIKNKRSNNPSVLKDETPLDLPEPEVTLSELTDPLLAAVLASFKDKLLLDQKKMMVNMLSSFKFELKENNHICITVEGNHNASMMEDERLDLIGLTYSMTGVRPTAEIVITTSNQPREVYFTPDEKFKKLLDDYPIVREFSKDLEMRIE
jgi:DNA polymerase-3 subunit gamma/tau